MSTKFVFILIILKKKNVNASKEKIERKCARGYVVDDYFFIAHKPGN